MFYLPVTGIFILGMQSTSDGLRKNVHFETDTSL